MSLTENNKAYLKVLARQFTCNCGKCEQCKDEEKMVLQFKEDEQIYYTKRRSSRKYWDHF